MANRSMLFAARALPSRKGETVSVLALGEFGWDIPTLYKLLVSVRPQLCHSVVFGYEGPLAIAGDREGGMELLKILRAQTPANAPAIKPLDEAIAYLSKVHIDHPYFLLEPGEILDLESGPMEPRLNALVSEIKALRMDAMIALARKSAEANHWATQSWSSILYFEPAGSERPPIDPEETFLSTTPEHLLAHRNVLAQCRKLTSVSLNFDGGANDLAKAIDALNGVPSTYTLHLHGAAEELPPTIWSLSTMEKLVAGNMGLQRVPDARTALPRLAGLYLQQNKLDRLPDCVRRMPNLADLSIWGNPLGELPDWIGDLQNLESFIVGDCGLQTVPPSLWRLRKLKSLKLDPSPALTLLPEGIEALRALEDLNLNGCGLTKLPDGIGKLTALKELRLSGNRLSEVPDSLYDMPLDTLVLAGNPYRPKRWLGLFPARRFRARNVIWK